MVERHDLVPGSHCQLGEHARADGDEQDRLDQSTPSSSATKSTAVTRSAVVPGFSALPSWRSEASKSSSAVRPRAAANAAGGEHLPRARRDAPRRVGAALAGDQRVRDGREEAQRQLDDGVARAQPVAQRVGEGGQPELEGHRMVGHVLACDRVALRGRRHGFAQRHAGLVAHVVLDRLVQAAGAGQADRRVGIAGVVDGERAQHVAEALAERSIAKRRARERRQQQRDAEVGVGAGDAARGAHRGQHRLADPPLARAAELRAEREPAAEHVLVGGVVEVVARRDVAGLLGAHLQHTGELRGAHDLVRAETGRVSGGGRASARRLLDRHLRHRIAEMSHQEAQPDGPRLDGLRAVVTGASSGIGAAIAEAFGGAGATVLVTHRDSGRRRRGRRRADRPRRRQRRGRPGGPGHPRGMRGAGGAGPRAARRTRRVGEQRGRGRAHGRRGRVGLGAQARPPAGGRPQGDRRVLVRRRRRHARAGRRRDDREHELGPRDGRNGGREPRAVQRRQGRRAGLQQEPGARPGADASA